MEKRHERWKKDMKDESKTRKMKERGRHKVTGR